MEKILNQSLPRKSTVMSNMDYVTNESSPAFGEHPPPHPPHTHGLHPSWSTRRGESLS